MRGGRISFKSDKTGIIPSSICWEETDRKTGKAISKSAALVSFETITGEAFSLMPDAIKPYFRTMAVWGSCIYGKLINYPGVDPTQPFKTDEITSVTTQVGEVIPTLLALTASPTQGTIIKLSPEQLSDEMAHELLDSILRKAEADELPTPPTPTSEPKNGKPRGTPSAPN